MKKLNIVASYVLALVLSSASGLGGTAALAAPANDSFASAQTIVGASGTASGSNSGATFEANEPYLGNSTVWYRYTVPTGGTLTIDTFGSNYDTQLAVYTGSALTSLNLLAKNDQADSTIQSKVVVPVAAGTVYSIQVGGWLSSSGDVKLNWLLVPPPANDNFVSAQVLSGTSGTVSGTTNSATTEAGEPLGNGPVSTVWYKYTATTNGGLKFSVADDKTMVAIYRGNALNNLVELGRNWSTPNAAASVTAGTTYFVQCGTAAGYAGSFQLSWVFVAPPANDAFAAAVAIAGGGGTVTGSTLGATIEANEPAPAATSTVWYSVSPTTNGTLVAAHNAVNVGFSLSVFTGSALSTLIPVAVAQDYAGNSKVRMSAGQTYYLRIASSSSPGAFSIALTYNQPPVNTSVSQATTVSLPGVAHSITTVVTDADGGADVGNVRLLINGRLAAAQGLIGYYDVRSGLLYLYDDAGTALLGGYAPGSESTISNARGTLNCADSSVVVGDNSLSVTWNFTPQSSFAGAQQLYVLSSDMAGNTSRNGTWDKLGSWTISNTPPVNTSVNPGSGTSTAGVARTVTSVSTDANGAGDIRTVRLLINGSLSAANGLVGAYDKAANKLYLYNDAGNATLGGFTPGSANVITNSQGSLNCAATTVLASGNTVTINWNFTPAGSFAGLRQLFCLVTDSSNAQAGWDNKGTWNVAASGSPMAKTYRDPSAHTQ